ncbi:hypothetical protein [Mycobacterium sp. OTB74]|jgi:hypothetical protein|uniref:hypothetical protein n=1 Tax=Mycobacterium sp. OTB74 TaxID=1853452 RepID=UPI002476F16D|nr:hypothetical protein [Mycobacterium sp. OTB74]MDH6247471.1 hypothetical protein [Mycobacterium sp. OTB74]
MNATRIFGFSIISAGIVGSAALGLAGTAGATTIGEDVRPPHVVATPDTKAQPAPQAIPGARWHHGVYHVTALEPHRAH